MSLSEENFYKYGWLMIKYDIYPGSGEQTNDYTMAIHGK